MIENIETTEESTAQPVQSAPNPELTINDLSAMRNLIEVVSVRGAFKANELTAVGTLFDKLTVFLNAAQKAQEQNGEQNG
jgi:hypothetical protein